MYSSNASFTPGNIITYWAYIPNNGLGDMFFASSSSGGGQMSRIDGRSSYPDGTGILATTGWSVWSGNGNIPNPAPATWDKIDIVIPSTSSETMYASYAANNPIAALESNTQNSGPIVLNNNGDYFGFQGDSAGSGTDYWDAIIVRSYPPGGVMPEISFGPAHSMPASMSQLSPTSQTVQKGTVAVITSDGVLNGTGTYAYQWYESQSKAPADTSANAVNANTLLGIGTANGDAQSQNASLTTGGNAVPGTYWFELYGTNSTGTTVNSTPVSITVVNPSGGGGLPTYHFTISDNIDSSVNSTAPIITVGSIGYYQGQLPATITSGSYEINMTFACSVSAGSSSYLFANDVYGIGSGISCGRIYTTDTGSITGIYQLSNITTTTTTTSTSTTSSTTLATTIPATTTIPIVIPVHETKNVSQQYGPVTLCPNNVYGAFNVNYTAIHSSFIVSTNSQSCFSISALNIKSTGEWPKAPSGSSALTVLNLTVSNQNASVNATIGYPCNVSSSSIAPYISVNGTWVEITPFAVDSATCALSFHVPVDPIIAIFEKQSLSPAAVITPPVRAVAQSQRIGLWIIIIAAACIVIIVLAIMKRKRDASRKAQRR